MKAFVTGGTGFLGSHVVEILLQEGWEVVALSRKKRLPRFLCFPGVQWVYGDLGDRDLMRKCISRCDGVFHVAADYRLWAKKPEEIYISNVEGTRTVMAASMDAGVSRVVYTSTVGALGLNKDGSPSDETTPVSLDDMVGHYKRSKYLAERVVEGFIRKGLSVVIVNPSTPVGPRDHKPTPTGQIIVDFLNGRMPAYVNTGLNVVHVRDVAQGHLLAFKHGRIGEKYILGHKNISLKELFLLLARITSLPSPNIQLPLGPVMIAAYVDEFLSRLRGKPPRIPLEGVRMSKYHMYFKPDKAVKELGLPQTPVETALKEAVDWYKQHGYCS